MGKKFKVTIEQNHEFTSEDLNDLTVSALEGGINYWCRKAVIKLDENKNYLGISEEDAPNVQFASDVIGYGGTLVLYDAESSDKWELTLDMFLKGIARYCKENNENLSDLLDNHDADTADSIVQYALFDEIVYC
jgi:hypothetical protein